MATEMDASWTYLPDTAGSAGFGCADFASTRAIVRTQLLRAFFGEPTAGVFSPSLQVLEIGCWKKNRFGAVERVRTKLETKGKESGRERRGVQIPPPICSTSALFLVLPSLLRRRCMTAAAWCSRTRRL
jgi:hypothetical protein